MNHPNASTALARVVVDELVRAGVGLFVASPGSRSTALVLAAADAGDAELVVSIDERSGAFHALGWAKATGRPAAVITTSGTAVANLMPAVVEAEAASVPLVVVSADRPPELRGVDANQTIDQVALFGPLVRHREDLGPAERHRDAPRWWRSRVGKAMAAARGWDGRPGPVHINLSFREPTVPVADDGRSLGEPYTVDDAGRDDGDAWTAAAGSVVPDAAVVSRLARALTARQGVVLAGPGTGGDPAVARLGERLGWPVLASAESGLRGLPGAIPTGHHLLAHLPTPPEMVLRIGGTGPSSRVADLLDSDVPQVVVGRRWSDPFRRARLLVAGDPGSTARLLAAEVEGGTEGEWLAWWEAADSAVRASLEPELSGPLTEPAAARQVGRLDADLLAVASSMPIRDVESFAWETPPIVANRGASGIDGFVSTALGAGRAAHRPLALTGDLSLLHDANGFLAEPVVPCVFVVIDNRGGGIFSFLPQARHAGSGFERLFVTPSRRDLADLARFHRLAVARVGEAADLAAAVDAVRAGDGDVSGAGSGGLVIVESDRQRNVEEHRRLDRVVADALASMGR